MRPLHKVGSEITENQTEACLGYLFESWHPPLLVRFAKPGGRI